jgi:RNA polymerase sigma-70 factor (ECF subfamily)
MIEAVAEPSTTSTRDLVTRALAGDDQARDAIYRRHADDVQRVIVSLRLRLRREEVEDAVQDTFLRLFRDLPRVDPDRSLRGYVLGIARNVALDRCRRARLRAVEPLADTAPDAKGARPEHPAERAEETELVARGLEALDPERRALLGLRHVQGLTMDELALALDCSVPTARARLRDAAALLGRELRRLGLSGPEVRS